MATQCSADGCEREAERVGLCGLHYTRERTAAMRAAGPGCSIPDCRKPLHALGLCSSHHHRLKTYGDPLVGKQAPKGERLAWLEAAMFVLALAPTDDCFPHPFTSTDDYGELRFQGKRRRMHEVVLILTGRELPPSGQHTRHLCGNPTCVNPRHITTGTPLENAADKIRHGNQPRGSICSWAKLTDVDVVEIFITPETDAALGVRFNVSPRVISAIKTRRSWRHLTSGLVRGRSEIRSGERHPNSKLTEDDIRAIRASSDTQTRIAERYGLAQATVNSIILRKTWKHID